MFFSWNGKSKFFIRYFMSGINAIIPNLLEMFFRNMLNKTIDKLKSCNSFFNIRIIFMPVVMKSNIFTIIIINARSSNNRSAKIATNIFCNYTRVTSIRFSIYIETIFMIRVASSFYFFKWATKFVMQFIK